MNEIDEEADFYCTDSEPVPVPKKPRLEEGVAPDLLDKIAEEAENYASAQATEAAERAAAAASRYTRAIVWLQVYSRVYQGAYYDKYFRLLREKTPQNTRPPSCASARLSPPP